MTAEAKTPVPRGRIGEIIADRYRILSQLGAGGMGAVYVAEHMLMRKRMALKLLHAEMAKTTEAVARFRREAEAVATLDHPNITAATDFGQTPDGSFFLVLELVDGVSLRQAIREGPMAAARALWIARQIALALDRAHAAGIVHRDLKPENVMLVERDGDPNFVKVLDFGVARIDANQEREGGVQALTRAGTVMGTPEYMAPEQALGERVTARADLYALGVVLYEMLTGLLPFEGDAVALLAQHVVAEIPPMVERAPKASVPPDIEALVRRLLEKDEKARCASARELVTAIDAVAGAHGISLRAAPMRSSHSSSTDETGERSRIVLRPSAVAEATAAPDRHDALAHTVVGAAAPAPAPAPAPVTATPAFVRAVRQRLADLAAHPQVREHTRTLRAQAEELLATLQAKTKLPRPTLVALLASALIVFVVAFLTTALVILLPHKSGSDADPASATASASAGSPSPASPTAAEATPEQVRAAAAGGTSSLEDLADTYPGDRALLRELALSYDAHERTSEALNTIERIARIDATPVPPELVRIVIRATAKTDTIDHAFRLLLDVLGEPGIDALVEIAESRDLPERARGRAISNLKRENVRAKARPATALLIDLDTAYTCEARLSALERLGSEADDRALPRLQALKSTRGCGRGGRYDCNSCLRNNDALERAVRAAENRDGR